MKGFPITARAGVCGLGADTASVMEALLAGERGLTRAAEHWGVNTFVGALPGELGGLPDALQAWESRQARMCAHVYDAVRAPMADAVARWGAGRVGVCIGTSTAGIAGTERAWAESKESGALPEGWAIERQHALFSSAQVLAELAGAGGPRLVVSTACSSSAKVFAHAMRWIRGDLCDAVLVGGIDTLCRMTLCGFRSLDVLSAQLCRPFSSERSGINIGEGGALFLVEREGKGPRVVGVGESSDAHHMTAPHPEGAGARAAMQRALDCAGLAPEAVDQINAHGTGTPQNDAAEGRAVLDLFGAEQLESGALKLVGTKGATGHMLGAAGAIEALFCLESIERGVVPPSVGCDPLDTAIGVPLSAQSTEAPTRVALSNSLAFGGSNVCVAFAGADE